MKTESTVAIIQCGSYKPDDVKAGISECLDLLRDSIPSSAGKILIKPNMLFPKPPEHAATTHPEVIRASAEYLKNNCNPEEIKVGDSPAGVIGDIRKFWDIQGHTQAALDGLFELVPFETGGDMEEHEITAGKTRAKIRIAQPVADADFIVNMPKMKTHTLTLYTGALKNIYGVIPGLLKANLHTSFRHPFDFARFIVEINKTVKPQLHIMDGIVGMEGEGPSGGNPREAGVLMASTDPAALDATAAVIMGMDPLKIPTIRIAGEEGVGNPDISRITYPGLTPADISIPPFTPPGNLYSRIPRFLYRILFSFFKTKPYMTDDCIKCMKCAKMCPADAISLKNREDSHVSVDYSKCISCFCCGEICEYKAVELQTSWLAKKLLPKNQRRLEEHSKKKTIEDRE